MAPSRCRTLLLGLCAVFCTVASPTKPRSIPHRYGSSMMARRNRLSVKLGLRTSVANRGRCDSQVDASIGEQEPSGGVKSRRDTLRETAKGLVISGLLSSAVAAPERVLADEEQVIDSAPSAPFSKKVYFDVSVNEQEIGRIVIGVYNDGSQGQERFMQLAEGAGAGLDYRRSLFTFVSPDKSFIKNGGVGSITGYGSKEIALAGGKGPRELTKEVESQKRSHDKPGIVSLVIRSPEPPPAPEKKLVAASGRLVTVEEMPKGYVEPNGSEFIMTTQPVPYLDKTNLVVGEVLEGMDVISKISNLPTSKPKGKDDPFFKIGKSIGDSRAVFMATRFGRPFARVQITDSGVFS
mmetsp:Transcript_24881/g.34595  ORF Transcript_24881/g.34595 Transcript_24881/m.34595 type:complete len:351 (+) Transcript_24881:2-1054(+)